MLRFAANLSLMFQEFPFEARFAAASDAGFAAVEMQFPYDRPADEIAGHLKAAGLQMVLINAPPGNYAGGDRGLAAMPGREADFDRTLDTLETYATALGVRRAHVLCGDRAPGLSPDEMDAAFIANMKRATARFAPLGLTLTLEPLNRRNFPTYHLATFAHARRLIEAVRADNLGLQYDSYNRQLNEGDLENGFRDNLDIIRHVQVAAVPSRHEPDEGEVAHDHLFRVIDAAGYDGWIGLEYKPRAGTVEGLKWMERYRA